MKKTIQKPVILLPADAKQFGEHVFHAAGQKYIQAVADAAGGMPLIMPAITHDIAELLEIADGILLTGSVSNVHPSHFSETVQDESLPLDPARDALTLQLIRAAIQAGVPLLAICRGFQEMNVAFGGSLHQAVHKVPGLNDHREDKNASLDGQYGPSHTIRLSPNGQLAGLTHLTEMMVNSLHGQGLNQLGAGLVADAYAPDGLVEAIYVKDAVAFALGVQWHPEWKVLENPANLAIFTAFGAACQHRRLARQHGPNITRADGKDQLEKRVEAPPD